MQPVIRKSIKWSFRVFVAILIIFALQITVLAFPQPFFSHKMETAYGAVYSDRRFTPELADAVNEVTDRLGSIELYNQDKDDCVFLCHSPGLYGFFARLSLVPPMAQGYNLSIFNNSFISISRLNHLKAKSQGFPPYAITEGDPAHTIVHELVHQYMSDALGIFAYRKIPPMKAEGYAEYGSSIAVIRKDSINTLSRRIDYLLDDNNWYRGYDRVREHYRAGLVVEYLSEIKSYGFNDFISDTLALDAACDDMLEWYGRQEDDAY